VASFGSAAGCTAQLTAFEPHGGGALVRANWHGQPIDFTLAQSGVHWGLNSLCVLLMLEALGVELQTGLQALAGFAPLEGRGLEREVPLGGGAFTLIDESYNANPISMRAAIATLGAHPADGRRIAVLTDMLELGADADRRHAELAGPLEAARTDLVFCAGSLMRSLWDELPAGLRGGYASSAAELAPAVVEAVRPGDVVMVKGSNGSKATLVAAALVAGQAEPVPTRGAA
jgi:UDP-N-acetylmuramoyl-tripeptide--D-alanyl-D-alanine ligase